MEYLVTYYIKNTSDSKGIFNIIPYKSSTLSGSEEEIFGLVATDLKKYPYFRCCSIMERSSGDPKVLEMKYMLDNPHFKEEELHQKYRVKESVEFKDLDDSIKKNGHTTEEGNKRLGFEVKLDHEEKIIRLGSTFYELKGVLICEATEEDKKKHHCGRYISFPIVDDNWNVCDDECIAGGIEYLTVAKKGDTIPLIALKEAADYNARVHDCSYDEQLMDLERLGVTISNRKSRYSAEELPDNIVIGIDRIRERLFRMDTDPGSYYIPRRFFYVGDDDELYEDDRDGNGKPSMYQQKLVERIVDDVSSLSWFFNKPNLRVLITAITENGFGFKRNELGVIPKDWFYTVQTLESEINQKLDEIQKEYPNDYNRNKRPDIIEEKA